MLQKAKCKQDIIEVTAERLIRFLNKSILVFVEKDGIMQKPEVFLKEKINPMVGAAGISAFPMASRVVQKLAAKEEPGNIILMHAAGANVAGQIASAVAGGLVINLVTRIL